MFGRNKIAMILAEFLGTATLASAIFAVAMRTQFAWFTGAAAGLVFGALTLVVANVGQVHLNPALTIGAWTLRKISTAQAVVYIAAQMLGGLVAWRLFEYLTGQSLQSIAGKSFEWKVLVAEVIGAFIFTWGTIAAIEERSEGLVRAAVVGTSLFLGMLVASIASNAIINPAVAVSLRSWNWAYAGGPVLGAVIGANLYGLLFAPTPLVSVRRAASSVRASVSRSSARRAPSRRSTSKRASASRRRR